MPWLRRVAPNVRRCRATGCAACSGEYPTRTLRNSGGCGIEVYERREPSIRPVEINNLIEVNVFDAVMGPAIEQHEGTEAALLFEVYLVLVAVEHDATAGKEVDVLAAEQHAHLIE